MIKFIKKILGIKSPSKDDTNCPKCNYDIYEIYNRVYEGGKSRYCKITNIHSGSCGDFYGTDWDVECICPKCKTKFTFSDGDY